MHHSGAFYVDNPSKFSELYFAECNKALEAKRRARGIEDQSYGTFSDQTFSDQVHDNEAVEFRLRQMRGELIGNCLAVTLVGIFIPLVPVALLIVFFYTWFERTVGHRKGYPKLFLLLLLTTIAGMVFLVPPLVAIATHPDGMKMMEHALEEHMLLQSELRAPLLSFWMLGYLACYIWTISHHTHALVEATKRMRLNYLHRDCSFRVILTDEAQRKMVTRNMSQDRVSKGNGDIFAEDLIEALSDVPGWEVVFLKETEHETIGEAELEIARDGDGNQQQPSDLLVNYRKSEFYAALSLFWRDLKHILSFAERMERRHAKAYSLPGMKNHRELRFTAPTLFMVALALLRAAIPRLWVHYYWGQPALPLFAEPQLCVVLLIEYTLVAVATGAWLILLNQVRIAYNHDVTQVLILGALVSSRRRREFREYLMREWHLSAEAADSHLETLPRLDLSRLSNIKAWWAVREFVKLDIMDEQVPMEIALLTGVLYIVGNAVFAMVNILWFGKGDFLLSIAFDAVVFGAFTLLAIFSCTYMNGMMDEHVVLVISAQHRLMMPEARHIGKTGKEVQHIVDREKQALEAQRKGEAFPVSGPPFATVAEAHEAKQLLEHLIHMIEKRDHRQKFFGIAITPTLVGSVGIAILGSLGAGITGCYRVYTAHEAQKQHLETTGTLNPGVHAHFISVATSVLTAAFSSF